MSASPDTSPLQVMKLRAQQLFSAQPQAEALPEDIPDLGTLGNYLLTRQVSHTSMFVVVLWSLFFDAQTTKWFVAPGVLLA